MIDKNIIVVGIAGLTALFLAKRNGVLIFSSAEIPPPTPIPITQRDPLDYPESYTFTPMLQKVFTREYWYPGPSTASVRPPGMAQNVQPPLGSQTFTPDPVPPPKLHTLGTATSSIPAVRPPGGASVPMNPDGDYGIINTFFYPGFYVMELGGNVLKGVVGGGVLGGAAQGLGLAWNANVRGGEIPIKFFPYLSAAVGGVAGGIMSSGASIPITVGSFSGSLAGQLVDDRYRIPYIDINAQAPSARQMMETYLQQEV